MRIPDCGPFGETLLEAKTLAIVAAFLLNRPGGGCVESVVTDRTHLFLLRSATCCPPGMLSTTADGTPPSAKVGILWPKASSTSENIDRTEGSVALQFSDSLWFPRHHPSVPTVATESSRGPTGANLRLPSSRTGGSPARAIELESHFRRALVLEFKLEGPKVKRVRR